MRVYLPRFYVSDFESNLAELRRHASLARTTGSDCIVFPEQFLTGYHGHSEPSRIRRVFTELSGEFHMILHVFGTISEDGFNRQTVFLAGREITHYDKVHLFLPNDEDKLWRIGDRYVALRYGAWRIGLITCNDVRFPEQARALKLEYDINLLVCPALWPWQRDHIWSALLQARAIENGCFVIGCCVAGVSNGTEDFDGAGNHVYDPLGNELQPVERNYSLDLDLLQHVTVDTRAQYCRIEKLVMGD